MFKIKLIIFCLILSLVSTQCKKVVFSNPGYAIGVIVFYTPAYKTSSVIDFAYSVNGKLYSNNYGNNDYGWTVPASGNYNSGDKYMVEYEQGSPQTARMLFDYPVPDSTVYKQDVIYFQSHPPH